MKVEARHSGQHFEDDQQYPGVIYTSSAGLSKGRVQCP
jgi:hypothetical protein